MRLPASWLTCPLAVLALSTSACRWPSVSRKGPPSAEEAARKRQQRQAPVSVIAPGPASAGVLVGPEGRDKDGYPLRSVDRVALRRMLSEGRYAELDRTFEALQDAFEADPRCEFWPSDAADAFAIPDPALDAALDAWTVLSPRSFAPLLARAAHRVRVGFARRGGHYVAQTHADDFAAMEEAFAQARPDIEAALRIRPKLVAARRFQVHIFMTQSAEKPNLMRALSAGLDECPQCLLIRVTAILALRPRWGGSHDEMVALAREAPVAQNPRLGVLAGYVDYDHSDTLQEAKDFGGALAAIDRALAHGEHWDFLEQRASILDDTGDREAARRAINRAVELRPGVADLVTQRAVYTYRLKDYEGAARDLMEGLRLDPTDSWGRWLFPKIVQALTYEGWEAYKAGRREQALKLIDLASDLDPGNRDLVQRRSWILSAGGAPAPDTISGLRAAAVAAPDDLRAHQALDYALARQGRYNEVIEMWDEYLGRRPDDGRAHMERAGALHHLGRDNEARAAARRACELGVSEGCLRAR